MDAGELYFRMSRVEPGIELDCVIPMWPDGKDVINISQPNKRSLGHHDVYNARMAETYLATANYVCGCRHPAPGQDLIPLQRLHVFAHSRDPHPAIKLWCQVPFTKSKTIS